MLIENKKLNVLIDFLKNKKLSTLKILDISQISILADYFVVISMQNVRGIESLENDICEVMAKNNFELKNKEGNHSPWILLDYNDVVIHLLSLEYHNLYNIEKLWADAKVVDIGL